MACVTSDVLYPQPYPGFPSDLLHFHMGIDVGTDPWGQYLSAHVIGRTGAGPPLCAAGCLPVFVLWNSYPSLLRTFLEVYLADHLPSLVLSSYSNLCRLRGFLRELAEAFLFLHERYSLDSLLTVSRKELYSTLIESLFPIPVHRVFPGDPPGQDVLKRVKRMCVLPTAKTIFFKLHISTLPVKTWLHKKGTFVPWPTNCRLCNQSETIEQCFITCTDAYLF